MTRFVEPEEGITMSDEVKKGYTVQPNTDVVGRPWVTTVDTVEFPLGHRPQANPAVVGPSIEIIPKSSAPSPDASPTSSSKR